MRVTSAVVRTDTRHIDELRAVRNRAISHEVVAGEAALRAVHLTKQSNRAVDQVAQGARLLYGLAQGGRWMTACTSKPT
jgi:hypothetical protein